MMESSDNSKPQTIPEHPFWTFSVSIYTQDAVRNTLLELQDSLDLNMNLLLFCCWFAKTGRGRFSVSEVKQLVNTITPWHKRIVSSLRKLRAKISQSTSPRWQAINKTVAEDELTTEHIEQLLLTETINKPIRKRSTPQKLADACKNIMLYCNLLHINLKQQHISAIKFILSATFTNIENKKITEAWKKNQPRKTKTRLGAINQQMDLELS